MTPKLRNSFCTVILSLVCLFIIRGLLPVEIVLSKEEHNKAIRLATPLRDLKWRRNHDFIVHIIQCSQGISHPSRGIILEEGCYRLVCFILCDIYQL